MWVFLLLLRIILSSFTLTLVAVPRITHVKVVVALRVSCLFFIGVYVRRRCETEILLLEYTDKSFFIRIIFEE